jgi:serpin B
MWFIPKYKRNHLASCLIFLVDVQLKLPIMKNQSPIYLLALSIFLFIACGSDNDPVPVNEPTITPLKTALIESNNEFSYQIFNKIVENEENNTNIFISPLSMYYALGMASLGADSDTRTEFNSLLGWTDKDETEILESLKSLYEQLMPPNDEVKLSIANSLWQREGAPIKESYKDLVTANFDAEVRTLDFTNPESVAIINGWIADKTNDLIKDMLDQISSDAIMYLINAIYFKGDWLYVFDEEDNLQMPFYKADGTTTEVTFMRQKTNLNYLNNEQLIGVQLPYSDTNYCMTLLIPKEGLAIDAIIEEMNAESMKTWTEAMQMKEIEIQLPKFKYGFGTRNINPELQRMGLLKAYSPSEADFSKITDLQIYISRVMHKAFIEVNEKGSEAAAATIIEFENTSIGEETMAYFNKPFVFTIQHLPTQTLLFMGKVAYPEQ